MLFQRVFALAVIVTACGCGGASAPHDAGRAAGPDVALRAEPVAAGDPDATGPPRARYRYAVVPTGVHSSGELADAVATDPVVSRHFEAVDLARVRVEHTKDPVFAYVSYRVGEQVYWTSRRVTIPAGESVLTDGTTRIRARCGNAISMVPRQPTRSAEPDLAELDRVVQPPAPGGLLALPDPIHGTQVAMALLRGDMPHAYQGAVPIGAYLGGGGATGLPRSRGGAERPDGAGGGVPGTGAIDLPDAGAINLPGPGTIDLPGAGAIDLPGAGAIDLPAAGAIDLPGAGAIDLPAAGAIDRPATGAIMLPDGGALDLFDGGAIEPPRGPATKQPASVPEPALLLLLGSGGAAALARRLRRRV